MKKEEEKQIAPNVIAARAKKGLALATGNPLDKVVVSPPEARTKDNTNEETLIERVVSMLQRRKRSTQTRIRKNRLSRSRSMKRTRMASKEQLMNRARRMAKTMLRKRVAGSRSPLPIRDYVRGCFAYCRLCDLRMACCLGSE